MFNKEILDALVEEFGVENAILYCKMESRKSQLMFDESKRKGEIGSSEWEFEKDWWNTSEQELLTLKSKNNGHSKSSRKPSKIKLGSKTMVSVNTVRELK